MPVTTVFLGPVLKKWKKCKYHKSTLYVDDSHHKELLVFSSAASFVQLISGKLSPYARAAIADPIPKYLLLCSPVQYYQVRKGGCS